MIRPIIHCRSNAHRLMKWTIKECKQTYDNGGKGRVKMGVRKPPIGAALLARMSQKLA